MSKHNYRRQKVPKKKKQHKVTFKEYKRMCRFKFDLEEYPNEFDLQMIEDFGWYCELNQNGVSRDHMLSISYGWKRDISPKIIRHPANCKLMLFENNRDKAWRSSLNLTKLQSKILEWDRKYK